MVRAKFRVDKIAKVAWGNGVEITLSPQYDQSIPEDRRFATATPSGLITMYVDNPPASDYLKLGGFFYVDFTEVPKIQEAVA